MPPENNSPAEFRFDHGPFDDAMLRCRPIMRSVPGAIDAFRQILDAGNNCRIERHPEQRSVTIHPSEALLSLIEMFEADQLARMSSTETE